MNIFDIGHLWAGTEDSLHAYAASLERHAGAIEPEGYERPQARLLEVQGEIGLVSIKGPLNNTDSWINELMGATGYPEIRDALIAAATNPDIKAIALDIDSPGGAVSGLADTGDLIRTIDTKVKPVYAFTDGSMASAAYWLGSSARQLTASKAALVGSIGVILRHMEQSAAMEKAGIKATVIRAGKYKQLANPFEPLSDEGKAQMQQLADATYELFLDHVSEARGQSRSVVIQTMAEGRVFLGETARQVGLVDQIAGFDHFMSTLSTQIVDNRKNFNENKYIGATMTTRKALTEADIAAMAEGVNLNATLEQPETQDTPDVPNLDAGAAPEGEATAQAEGTEGIAIDESSLADASLTAGKIDDSTEKESNNGVVALLQGQLAASQQELITAKVELTKVKEQLDVQASAMEGLLDIAKKSVANMQIALGGSALNMDGRSAQDVLAEHTRLSADFQNRFKAGGVAATVAADPKGVSAPKRTSLMAAQLAAAKAR